MKPDLKTQPQIDIEMEITKGRGYAKVPYTKLFGPKKALDQWLLFSRSGIYCPYITPVEKVPLSIFLPKYFEAMIPLTLMSMVAEKNNSLAQTKKNLAVAGSSVIVLVNATWFRDGNSILEKLVN